MFAPPHINNISRGNILNRVLFAGLATVDIISYVPCYPLADEKVRAGEQMICAGGPATNAAVANAVLGGRSVLYTGLGQHALAKGAADELSRHGVEIIDDLLEADQLPIISSVVVDTAKGTRSVVYSDPGMKRLTGDSLTDDLLAGMDLLLVDGFYLDQSIELARKASELDIPVVLDGGSWKEGLEELLEFVSVAICSESFSHPGCLSPDDLIEQLKKYGIFEVAISRGGRSLLFFSETGSGEIEVAPVINPDTLGAGDILHGAFCNFYLRNGFTKSLGLACTIASQSCRYRGTRRWITERSGCS